MIWLIYYTILFFQLDHVHPIMAGAPHQCTMGHVHLERGTPPSQTLLLVLRQTTTHWMISEHTRPLVLTLPKPLVACTALTRATALTKGLLHLQATIVSSLYVHCKIYSVEYIFLNLYFDSKSKIIEICEEILNLTGLIRK